MLENVKVNGEIGGRRHILRTLYICPILYKISTSCMKKVQILKKKDPLFHHPMQLKNHMSCFHHLVSVIICLLTFYRVPLGINSAIYLMKERRWRQQPVLPGQSTVLIFLHEHF